MPNKYEREIEEILRNLETPEPRQKVSERIRAFNRPRPRPSREWRFAAGMFAAGMSETLLLVGVGLAALAALLFFLHNDNPPMLISSSVPIVGGITDTAILAILSFLTLVVAMSIGWRERFRGKTPPVTTRPWQGTVINITPIGPRRSPFNALLTQVRIIRLKLRYWRSHGAE